MKLALTKTVFTGAIPPVIFLLISACGARTPLDLEEEQPGESSGGAGGAGGAGGKAAGGAGGKGGGISVGGVPNTGGQPTPNVGGSGGRPPTGGYINAGGGISGGAGGFLFGGAGGNAGGTIPTGGSMSRGGIPTAGGVPVRGGSGGSPSGGMAGTIKYDAGVGGTAGKVGTDAGFDARDLGNGTDTKRDSLPDTIATATGGAGGAVACPGLAGNEELIDDLNDGDRYIPSTNGRVGSWRDSHDATPTGIMYPDPVNPFTPTATGDDCRKYAAYVKGSGFSDWGANFSFGLGSPYDASKYTGISFWAKTDAGGSEGVWVAFPDKDTYIDGGLCKENVTGPTQCNDHYRAHVVLNPTWKKQTVTFKELSQMGWGMQGTAFDPTTLYQVLFQIPVNATFSIWIDDVAFTY